MDTTVHWGELLRHPAHNDHVVQLYQDDDFLAEAVGEYAASGLRQGEAAVLIATPAHLRAFKRVLQAYGCNPEQAMRNGQLRCVDAEESLARIMVDGVPHWQPFHATIGNLLAEVRLQYPTVRAYGEMVDRLWRRDECDAAIRLEELWNELGRLQTFSLFCAYHLDPLDAGAYGGPLERVCKVHTHLIPARDYARFNRAVSDASKEVLDQPLAQMLLSLSANHRPATHMPLGQATLFWLKHNMPRTGDRVLEAIKKRALRPVQV